MENYEKIKVIGRGAYGTVYLSWRKQDKKQVIIKQIPVDQMTKEERQAALNEVKVLSMLSHPFIIEYYENFLEDKALMIVMEYAPGGTLSEFLQQRNGEMLEEEEVLKFFAQILLSLQHVHSKQILHRDLKTQNILMDKKQQVVKIGDFGISIVLNSKSKAYTVVGTPCYISPELCEGKPYNQKSDIWALGCVLYELTSLKRAFEAQTLPALILKIMRGTFAPVSDKYSRPLQDLILSMLHLDPDRRPSINQISAQPVVLGALMNLLTDFGKIPCRAPRPLSNISGANRGRQSRTGMNASKGGLEMDSMLACNVYCWGGGVSSPLRLPLPSPDTQVIQVSAGRTQKAAVTKAGRLFQWEAPVLGADASQTYIPRFLEGQSAVTIQHVSCGDLFMACLTDRGILMTFGSGTSGALGHGNYTDVSQAKIVERLLGFEVIQVSCGRSHVLAVTNEHQVFAWGRGDNGRLGLGSEESFCAPQQVSFPEPHLPTQAFCGIDCSVVLTTTGQVLCSGSNRYNKLALDPSSDGQVEEVHSFELLCSPPLALCTVTLAALGTSHTAVITDNGELFTFGSDQFGQLGHSGQSNRLPQQVNSLDDSKVTLVACGDTFTVATTSKGTIFSWGNSSRGRLGRNDDPKPQKVILPEDVPCSITALSSNHGNTLLVTEAQECPPGLTS